MATLYRNWAPTQFDCKGMGLDDRQDWLVLPVCQTRDSGELEASNFAAALKIMGDESETVEVHRFGHWGPGWIEIILAHPSRAADVDAIQESLENYPVLDDEDFSRREWESYESQWADYGARDFTRHLQKEMEFSDTVRDFLDDADRDALRKLYEDSISSGEYYYGESSGIALNIHRADCSRADLATFIHEQRAALAAK